MPLIKGQSAPGRGWGPPCTQDGVQDGKAGWAQIGKGRTPKETGMDSPCHWDIRDFRA